MPEQTCDLSVFHAEITQVQSCIGTATQNGSSQFACIIMMAGSNTTAFSSAPTPKVAGKSAHSVLVSAQSVCCMRVPACTPAEADVQPGTSPALHILRVRNTPTFCWVTAGLDRTPATTSASSRAHRFASARRCLCAAYSLGRQNMSAICSRAAAKNRTAVASSCGCMTDEACRISIVQQ